VNVAVGKLRAALGDSAENPSFIEMVPRHTFMVSMESRELGHKMERMVCSLFRHGPRTRA